MQNSSSPSPILDFGGQHATVARVPTTARSLEIAAQRSVLLRPRGNITGSKATADGTQSELLYSTAQSRKA